RIRLGIRHLAPAESTAPSSAATPLAPAASSMASGRDCRPDQWLASLPERQLAPEQDLNRLLLDYLRHQGHLEAAEAFQREARGLPTPETAASGRIDEAAELLESARPGLLASRPGLEFRLRLQQLLELVRVGRPSEALDLAQQRLAPLAEARPERLSDLEEAMGLLAFERPAESAAFGHWLGQGQRRRLAGLLDAAIAGRDPEADAEADGDGRDAAARCRLDYLLRLLLWSQDRLASAGVRFPRLTDLAGAGFDGAPSSGGGSLV
uniref:LisH domain-containing protein n=1 Tax=Macrostomum lignano TaxID=282301 RepID=A0A1I8I7G8_9PLAT